MLAFRRRRLMHQVRGVNAKKEERKSKLQKRLKKPIKLKMRSLEMLKMKPAGIQKTDLPSCVDMKAIKNDRLFIKEIDEYSFVEPTYI